MTRGEFDPRPGVRRIVFCGSAALGAFVGFILIGHALGLVR